VTFGKVIFDLGSTLPELFKYPKKAEIARPGSPAKSAYSLN
jgi:hypothetical protein